MGSSFQCYVHVCCFCLLEGKTCPRKKASSPRSHPAFAHMYKYVCRDLVHLNFSGPSHQENTGQHLCGLKPVSPWIGPNQEKPDLSKPSSFEPLYQPYFGFWLFAWSRCGRIVKKIAENIPGTKITQYFLRQHIHRVMGSRRQVAQIRPKTFERKLCPFGLKEPLIKI